MAYFINSVSSLGIIRRDIKSLIPDPQMRRRMSVIVKSGVATAMDCLAGLPDGEKVSAIIVATGLGCLADSEKFLRNVIRNGEQLITPTPFIQSTFNTIGAQIALLTGNSCYNMTYTHGMTSFQNALLDTVMKIDEGAENVLLGAADEATPTLEKIAVRMGLLKGTFLGEGYHFFVLSSRPLAGCMAVIKNIKFGGIQPQCGQEADCSCILTYEKAMDGIYDTSEAKLLYDGIMKVSADRCDVTVETPAYGGTITQITVGCM